MARERITDTFARVSGHADMPLRIALADFAYMLKTHYENMADDEAARLEGDDAQEENVTRMDSLCDTYFALEQYMNDLGTY